MEKNEQYNEEPFDNDEMVTVKERIKNTRTNFIIISVVLFVMYLISPFIPGRGRNPGSGLIFHMAYFEALLYYLPVVVIFILIFYFRIRNEFIDLKNGIKIKMQTQITQLKTSKNGIKIKVSNPNYQNKWITISKGHDIDELKVNDLILINFLPKSKIVLNCKRMID
jgi:hypothetical protein